LSLSSRGAPRGEPRGATLGVHGTPRDPTFPFMPPTPPDLAHPPAPRPTRPDTGEEGSARGLLLLGHGSDRGPEAARPVRELAGELRGRGAFLQVEVGFWKEEPFMRDALRQFRVPEVAVVPIFTSVGHYTERVIPRELALDDPARRPDGMRVRLCPPVGTHPGMVGVVLERAEGALDREGGDFERDPEAGGGACALVLVGHGTPRHLDSGGITRGIARMLEARWPHGPVAPAFLDEEPGVAEVIGGLGVDEAIVVPFFIAEGWHAGVTLPASLGVEQGEGRLGDTRIRYTPPVGTHPRLAEFVMELAGG